MTKACDRCSAENPAGFTFCFHCGAKPKVTSKLKVTSKPKPKAKKRR